MENITIKKTFDLSFDAVRIEDQKEGFAQYQGTIRNIRMDVIKDIEQALRAACDYNVQTKIKAFYDNNHHIVIRSSFSFIIIENESNYLENYFYITREHAENLIKEIDKVCNQENIVQLAVASPFVL